MQTRSKRFWKRSKKSKIWSRQESLDLAAASHREPTSRKLPRQTKCSKRRLVVRRNSTALKSKINPTCRRAASMNREVSCKTSASKWVTTPTTRPTKARTSRWKYLARLVLAAVTSTTRIRTRVAISKSRSALNSCDTSKRWSRWQTKTPPISWTSMCLISSGRTSLQKSAGEWMEASPWSTASFSNSRTTSAAEAVPPLGDRTNKKKTMIQSQRWLFPTISLRDQVRVWKEETSRSGWKRKSRPSRPSIKKPCMVMCSTNWRTSPRPGNESGVLSVS